MAKSFVKFKPTLFLMIFIILFMSFMSLLFWNYYDGKEFQYCPTCLPNTFYLVDVKLPNTTIVECLESSLRKHGTILSPTLNFNNAKGKKLNARQLHEYCPTLVSHFLTPELLHTVSKEVGEQVSFADETEQYRIFARIYNEKDDFINWHYDNNFTKGKRYTLVIPIVVDDCNSAEFQYKDRNTKKEIMVDIPMGKGLVYNGSELYHRITEQTNGCTRVVVIIPLYTNYSKSIFGEIREKLRNMTDQQLTL